MGPNDTPELERRNRELGILNTIAQALNREVDLDLTLRTALAQVVELLNLHTGWIWLLDEATGESYLAAAQNLPPGLAHAPERMEGWCYCLDTFREGDLRKAANINIITCTRLKALVDGTDGLRYHASIPLVVHGRKLGLLNVVSPEYRKLSADDLRLLYTVGDLVSIAIERARLFARSVDVGAVEERNRLAREIHDTLAQGLAALTLQLETADALLEAGAGAERTRQVLQQALALTRANLDEARRSVLDLRAAPLEGRTLAEALTTLAESEGQRGGLAVCVDVVGGSRPLPARVEAGLYRIVQEAITNVVRHARASYLSVQLTTQPDQVQLIVADDGQGFDPGQVPVNRYGLIGLNERTRLLGGHLTVQSSPGTGTRLDITVPLGGQP
jgi:two-component system NarL family sensor kinase